MNSLAFRSPSGVKVSSSAVRALNGVPVDAKAMRSRCAYVQQDDLFIGSLTAKEHLVFQVTYLFHDSIFKIFYIGFNITGYITNGQSNVISSETSESQ